MPLMDRIKIKSFLSFSQQEKRDLISRIQSLRINSLEEARTKKANGRTKSATKNLAKRGKTVADPTKAAEAALNKLSPEQLKKLAEMFA